MSLPSFTGECFIGGRWLKGSGPAFSSIAPADGVETWKGAEAGAADVEAAVAAARGAFPAWRRRPIEERIAFVRAFAKLVDARKADMAAVISRSTGKPLWDAATEAAAMVGKAELSVKAYAERNGIQLVLRFNGAPIDPNNREMVQMEVFKMVMYYDKSIDITSPVLTEMNRAAGIAAPPRSAAPAGPPARR